MTPDEMADRLEAAADNLGDAIARRVVHTAELGRGMIRANATGRPGPNVITGKYRSSWEVVGRAIPHGAQCTIGTNEPQGRRLEYGFYGTDSIGRHYCVDMETEALSRDGWVTHDQLKIGDEVLTLNTETWKSEWQAVTGIYRSSGIHNLIRMESSTFSSLTTADHRWPVQRYYGRKKVWILDTRTTETLSNNHRIQRAVPCANLPAQSSHSDALVELAAWFWTEGSYDWGRKDGKRLTGGRAIGIRISQSPVVNPENVESIRKCLYALFGESGPFSEGAHWKEHQNSWTKVITFRMDRVGAWLLERIVDRPDKVVSPTFLTSLTERQLRIFLDISMKADGYLSQTNVPVMGQNSLDRLRSFEIACALLGQPTTTRVASRKTGMWATSLIGKATCNPKANATRTDGKAFRSVYEPVQVDTTIWCPTTPNGTWLARRRGTVYYTGNSQPPYPHVGPAVPRMEAVLREQMLGAVEEVLG
ncbi:hypothetical protein [Streptomyces globisporus]|uniref:hypothetical protein n=1 Tax=Streptomyces globisporus TaxID=1908 RepID=UPI0037BA86E5